jgi:hypothetical protein
MDHRINPTSADAARLLAARTDRATRAQIVDRLLDDPATLQALRDGLAMEVAVDSLAGRIEAANRRRWFSFDGWAYAGIAGAGLAAALMVLAPAAPLGDEQLGNQPPQQLMADTLYDASFEPNGLFGGDFEG